MKYIVLILFLILGGVAKAQQVDYNRIILPDGIDDVDLSEKLVRLAWHNYPANEVAQHELLIAQHKIGVAGSNWLSTITLTGNMNEFNINPNINPTANNFYPRYNIGVNIPLGTLIETPKKVKIAKEEYEIARLNVNQLKLNLRAEVLTRYRNYLTEKSLLQMQTITVENSENTFALTERKFIQEEITLEEYNAASAKLNLDREDLVNRESTFEIAKIKLEALIGVPLESIE